MISPDEHVCYFEKNTIMAKKGVNSKVLTIENTETEETVDVYVRYSWYYDPGRNFMPDGDVGYPPESEIEIIEFSSPDTEEPLPEWLSPDMVEEALNDADYLFESEDYCPDC